MMLEAINDIINHGSPIDILLFFCGLVVLGMVIANARHGKETRSRLIAAEKQVILLDRHCLLTAYILEDKLGINTIQQTIDGEWTTRHPFMTKE